MQEHDIRVHFIKITENFSGQRIDNFLRLYLKTIPKSMIYRIIRTGAIRINKKRIKFQYKLQTGDLLRIPPIQNIKLNKPCQIITQCVKKISLLLKSAVLYEDNYLLVLNKPTGIAVHGGSGIRMGIIEGLRAVHPKAQFLELVHRLDRGTSGVLLIAKKRTSLIYLQEQLRLQKIRKEYLALVCGRWDACVKKISIALMKKNTLFNRDTKFMCTNLNIGKLSTTYFQIKERFGNIATLLLVMPITGRTHQIRVHTQYLEHPIVGDGVYGNVVCNMQFKKIFEGRGLYRLFLHASMLCFTHPYTKKILYIYAPIDQSFYTSLCDLRSFILDSSDTQFTVN